MKNIAISILVALLCVSCSLLKNENVLDTELEKRNAEHAEELEKDRLQREFDAEVQRRFSLIRRLIESNELSKASEILASMSTLTEYKEELTELQKLLYTTRTTGLKSTNVSMHQRRMQNETVTGLLLPDTYGSTIQIAPTLEPTELPKGPLEKLLAQKVSMKVTNMPLADLAMQLRDIDGVNIADPLNVIFADETVKNKTFSCNFKDVPLYEIFAYISRNLGIAFNISENLIWVTTAPKSDNGLHLETHIIHLRHGAIPHVPEGLGVTGKTSFTSISEEDTELERALKAFFEKNKTGGYYSFFPTRNLLIITDTRENIRQLEKIIHELDKTPYQVVIEAKFISVSESDLRDLGVEITKRNGGQTGVQITPDDQTNANLSDFFTQFGAIKSGNVEGIGAMTISGILGNRSYDLLVSAIESKNSAVTLSVPRVTVLNNRTARIRKGDKYFYFEEYALQTVNRGDLGNDQVLVPRGKPTALQTGITFDVKVNVGNDAQTILLGLKPELIKLLGWENYDSSESTNANNVTTTVATTIHVPRTHEQGVATSVAIRSGETVVLGGMVENAKSDTVKKVPFLGDLPFVGWLFRHTEVRETPTNLLIFVTATIINENGEYVRYVEPPVVTPEDVKPLRSPASAAK